MGVIRSGRHAEADGEITVERGAETSLRWSEIVIAVFDDAGEPADPDMTTGTVTGAVLKTGSGKRQDFVESVDLSSDPWSWEPEISTVTTFYFSVSGLNTDYTYEITISSWE